MSDGTLSIIETIVAEAEIAADDETSAYEIVTTVFDEYAGIAPVADDGRYYED